MKSSCLLLPACALLFSACQESAGPGTMSHLATPEFDAPARSGDEAEPTLSPPAQLAGDRLALDIFRRLAAEREGNIVFSPASLESVLHGLRACAAGGTRAEILALPLGKPGVKSALRVQSADALFVDEGVQLKNRPPHVHRVSFAGNAQEAAENINDWCEEQTHGLIPRLVSESEFGPYTRLLALNTIYLNEKWLHPFDESATESSGRFRKADGSSVRVPLMSQKGCFRLAEGADWRAVALFYRRDGREGEPACFIGILPRGNARDFARGLTVQKYNRIRRALAAAQPQEVELTLPRMELDSKSFSLKPALMQLGMRKAFKRAQANFSALTDERLYLDDIRQRCHVIVSESGTEASAASSAELLTWSLPPSIRFDRPFVWAIGDLSTAAPPFFLGLYEGD